MRLKWKSMQNMLFVHNWFVSNYTEQCYAMARHFRAVDIAFAFMRVDKIDYSVYRSFLRNEIQWSDIHRYFKTLKVWMAVFQKISPLTSFVMRPLVKRLYPYVFK